MASYQIEWVGTGSGLNPVLGNTAFIIRGSGDRQLLVDCGATVPTAILKSGAIVGITDYLITHAHGDHFHGLEAAGFYNYFALGRRGDRRPNLFFAGSGVAAAVATALEASMGLIVNDTGEDLPVSLSEYFNIITTDRIQIPGLPEIRCVGRKHVGSLENFGLEIEGGVFYSGDTVEVPPAEPNLIFQDCQFFDGGPGDVHISFSRLCREVPAAVKARTHLVHVGGGWDKVDTQAEGFAGIVKPGDRFEISLEETPAAPVAT